MNAAALMFDRFRWSWQRWKKMQPQYRYRNRRSPFQPAVRPVFGRRSIYSDMTEEGLRICQAAFCDRPPPVADRPGYAVASATDLYFSLNVLHFLLTRDYASFCCVRVSAYWLDRHISILALFRPHYEGSVHMILPYNWKESLKPGNLRDTINRNSAVVSIVAVVVIIVVLALSIRSFMGGGSTTGVPSRAYYWDTSNGTLHIRPMTDYPPLTGATGKPTLVQAYFYACGSCSDKKLAYLQEYSPQAKAMLDKMIKGGQAGKPGGFSPMAEEAMMSQNSVLVRSPAKGSPWVPLNSPQGQQVTTPPTCPGSQTLKICSPN